MTSTYRLVREAIISCGTSLDHFRLRWLPLVGTTNVEQFPNPNNLDHLASIYFTSIGNFSQFRRDHADATLPRRIIRRPFRAPEQWPTLETLLRSTLENGLVTVDVLADDVRQWLAEASRLTEVLSQPNRVRLQKNFGEDSRRAGV
jgi:hypothetical protein